MDMLMLTHCSGGKERSFSQFEALAIPSASEQQKIIPVVPAGIVFIWLCPSGGVGELSWASVHSLAFLIDLEHSHGNRFPVTPSGRRLICLVEAMKASLKDAQSDGLKFSFQQCAVHICLVLQQEAYYSSYIPLSAASAEKVRDHKILVLFTYRSYRSHRCRHPEPRVFPDPRALSITYDFAQISQ
ncbi:hypothetical protein F2Q70_00013575 [Brassica cretica]|uniref:Uncharacterized protein n=1 Tax=Brassica cretica TaxID=69181 RepID=A0A8S9M3M2_BRACR|nr:hypothetical protein F2Q70_00013575 [Brassica cretica]